MTYLITAGLLAGCTLAQGQTQSIVESQSSPTLAQAGAQPLDTATPTPLSEATATTASTPTAANPPTVPPAPTPSPLPAQPSTPAPTAASVPKTAVPANGAPPNSEVSAAYGLEVYKQQYCGVCHELAAANSKGIFGPAQNDIGAVAAERIQDPKYKGAATTAAEYIRESIIEPDVYLVEGYAQSRHHMPAFTHLSDVELEALVQLLLQQK